MSASLDVTIVAGEVRHLGGMERQLVELVEGLLARDVRVTLVARHSDLADHPSLRILRVRTPSRPFSLAYPLFLVAASLSVATRGRGLVHTTGAMSLTHADVVTVHLCHKGAREHVTSSRARRRTAAYRLNAWLAARLALLVERTVYRPRRVGCVVAVSPGLGREVARAYPALAGRLEVVPNGVDTGRFRPDLVARSTIRAAHELGDDDLVAIFVGGEWRWKGLYVAIEALCDASRWRLLVVGGGDQEEARRHAAELGVEDRVVFAGVRADPERYFAAADAFVLPTAYETFSLVTYEAAASGLPLVATEVSGIEDILEPGVTGWTVERDPASIARALVELEDDDARKTMGETARSRAQDYGWEHVVDRYVALYRSIAGAGRSSR